MAKQILHGEDSASGHSARREYARGCGQGNARTQRPQRRDREEVRGSHHH